MHSVRLTLFLGALSITVAGCGNSQTTGGNNGGTNNAQNAKSPDEQFADLVLAYEALTDAERNGEKGKQITNDLVALMPKLSDKAREQAAIRLIPKNNLKELGEALHNYPKTKVDGPNFPIDPKDIGKFDPKDGKFPFPIDPKDGKFPFPIDPKDGKFPFPIDPKDIKFPFPIDPKEGKFPFPIDPKDGKLPFPLEPGKIPELKLPSLELLPMPPSVPDVPKN